MKKGSLIFQFKKSLRDWIPIIFILLLASFLYLFQLGKESLWIDELFSIRDATKIFTNFPSNFSLNRPLYFILLHLWMKFGASEAWLRSLSVLFALGSIFLTYILGCRLYSKSTGLVAALLLTLSTLAINHAQEVRMYMVSICIGIAGSLIFTYLLEIPRKSYFISWLSLRFLAVLTTPINIILVGVDLLLIFYQIRQKNSLFKVLKKWFWVLGILLIPALLVLEDVIPPLVNFIKEKAEIQKASPGVKELVAGITEFTIGRIDPKPEGIVIWHYENLLYFYAFVLVFLLIVPIINLFRKGAFKKHLYLVIWATFPLVFIFLLSQIAPNLWLTPRYLLVAAPYTILLLAEGFVRLLSWQRQVAFLVIGIYIIAVSGSLLNYYTAPQREDWRGAMQVLNTNETPKDAIVIFPDTHSIAVEYYYEGSMPLYTIKRISGNPEINQPHIEEALRKIALENPHFWLISRFHRHREVFETIIAEQYQVQKHQKFTYVDLYLLQSNFDTSN